MRLYLKWEGQDNMIKRYHLHGWSFCFLLLYTYTHSYCIQVIEHENIALYSVLHILYTNVSLVHSL